MSIARRLQTILAILDSTAPNIDVLDEGITIVAAHLRRLPRDDYRPVTIGVHADCAVRDRQVLRVCNRWVTHDVGIGDGGVTIADADSGGRVVIHPHFRDHSDGGAIIIPRDSVHWDDEAEPALVAAYAGWRWGWAEIAPRLARALRTIPARATPKPILCNACKRGFFP